jgi:hypothetical protein
VALSRHDVPYTTRRTDGGVRLYPRLLRDRSRLPGIGIAIEYFESLLGHERRELQPEVLVEFFGEPKLARGLVNCLGHSYRFRSRRLEEVVGRLAARRLRRMGLGTPSSLRLWLFDRLNERHDGFVTAGARPELLAACEAELSLRAGQLEQVLDLDSAERMRLERVGGVPRPADVAAEYNFQVLEALLRHAELVELALALDGLGSRARQAISELCAAQQVDASLDATAGRLRVVGRQDALGVWARHGRRVARVVLELLDRARPLVTQAELRLTLRGRACQVWLGEDLLDLLGGPPEAAAGWEPDDLREWLIASAPALRATPGWRVRVLPEPRAWEAGLIMPELLVQPGSAEPAVLVCAVRGAGHARRLARVARVAQTGEPVVFVGAEPDLAALVAGGARTVAVTPRSDRGGRAAFIGALRMGLAPAAARAA